MVDALTRLYEDTEQDFVTNGIGGLPDATYCTVEEKENDGYELEMGYPITGKRYSEIRLRRILFVKPDPYREPQPFRIYAITKPIDGIVTVYAAHISYDLSGYPAKPFQAANAAETFEKLGASAVVPQPFTFWTDVEAEGDFSLKKPASMRSLLGGSEGTILDLYGGEYEFDRFAVKLHTKRGLDRGVTIRYRKNLTDLEQEENCDNVYSGVYPFWYSESDGLVELSDKILKTGGERSFTRILTLDLTDSFDGKPTEAQLKEAAEKYIEENELNEAKISLTVSFVLLSQSAYYRNFAPLEQIQLCDTVGVFHEDLGVDATTKCVRTKYDVLNKRYEEIELGEVKSNISAVMADQGQALKDVSRTTIAANKIGGKIAASQIKAFSGEETVDELKCERFWFNGHYVKWSGNTLVKDD